MLEKFYPKLIVENVQSINLNMLIKKGIKGLILDIDNTLVPSFVKEPDKNTLKWVNEVQNRGIKICIVSNARKKRVELFNEKLKLDAIHNASKPNARAFNKAVELFGIEASQTAVIGDQIFTDVYGGNKLGMYTILVKPIHREEFFFVKLKRIPERYILKKYYSLGKK